jgi:tetratricopeptide (TPR) repeat protein
MLDHEHPVTNDLLSLSDLFARYVSSQASRIQESGLTPDLGSEVVLHDAGPVQAVDPRMAWDEAVVALNAGAKPSLPAPSSVPDWRGLVSAQEPALDLAFCAGNFPQMVRNLSLLLQGGTSAQTNPFPSASLAIWAEQASRKPFPQPLLAIGLLRLAQDFDKANRLLKERAADVPAEWKSAWKNEEAALAWHAGRREEAASVWSKGDAEHVPTLFNRGMAALFLGKPVEAREPLRQAVAKLPESGSWHHLARLYLTLAEMRQ